MKYLEKDITEVLPVIQSVEEIGLDVEASGLDPHSDTLLLIQIATHEETYVINAGLSDKRLVTYLFELIKERNILCIGQNIKYDAKMIYHNYGILILNMFDTMLAHAFAYVGVGEKFPSLKYLVKTYLKQTMEKDTRESFIGKTDFVFTEDQITYAARDAYATLMLKKPLLDVLKQRGQYKVFKMEMQLEPVVSFMEYIGILFDTDKWIILADDAKRSAQELEIRLYKYIEDNFDKLAKGNSALEVLDYMKITHKKTKAETKRLTDLTVWDSIKEEVLHDLNFGSSYQVKHILQSLKVPVKTTNAKELEIHRGDHEIVGLILSLREKNKRVDSFGIDFLTNVNAITKAIHTTLNQAGAVTGRFSSDGPNLQNIIAESIYRSAFISRPGYLLGIGDYSNIELRIIGEALQEPLFIEAFRDAQDLHTLTASAVFHVPVEEVTKEQRKFGKAMNFAVIYGSTASGLGYNFNISTKEATEYLIRYFNTYKTLKKNINKFADMALEKGYTVTMFGRKRFLSFPKVIVKPEDHKLIAKARRKAVNTLPQGTSADMIKLALIYMFYENPFGIDNFRPLLTVHDEIVAEFKEEIQKEAAEFMESCMKKAGRLFLKEVPVLCPVKVGTFWEK